MYDTITSLPIDKSEPSPNDYNYMKQLFYKPEHKQVVEPIISDMKSIFLSAILFFVLSLPFTKSLISRYTNVNVDSALIFPIVSTTIYLFLFYIIKNFSGCFA